MYGQNENLNGSRLKLTQEKEIPYFNYVPTNSVRDLIGKEVYIYPGDTIKKKGIIQEITPFGILFKITWTDDCSTFKQYEVDKLYFISYSANLSFREV